MAANPIRCFQNEVPELPAEVGLDPYLQSGEKLGLVPPPDDTESVLANSKRLAGSWAHVSLGPNAVLEAERQNELADEAHWLAA